MSVPSFSSLIPVNRKRWDNAQVIKNWIPQADRFVTIILANRARYESVQDETGVPWYLIAAKHMREASCNFKGVLHNGEQIIGTGRKTRLVPAGRGPFSTWEEAAIDAIRYMGLDRVGDWSIERVLYECERFNGFGYYYRSAPSPYVWSGTTTYAKGKYVRDGVYDPNHVDQQLGCAIVLKRLEQLGVQMDPPILASHAPVKIYEDAGESAPVVKEPLSGFRKVLGWVTAGVASVGSALAAVGNWLLSLPTEVLIAIIVTFAVVGLVIFALIWLFPRPIVIEKGK